MNFGQFKTIEYHYKKDEKIENIFYFTPFLGICD